METDTEFIAVSVDTGIDLDQYTEIFFLGVVRLK